jgi:dTDP-4-amino-4,6-dideoxygalactose transaminase
LNSDDFLASEAWGEGTITIPLFESMTEEEQTYVIDILIKQIAPLIGEK